MKIIAPLSISHESEVYVICGISCSVPKLMHVYFTRVNCLYFVFSLVFLFLSFFFFWTCSWHTEVPGPGIKPVPQQ